MNPSRPYKADQIAAHEIVSRCKKVVLVMDNLNTHNIASLYATFQPQYPKEIAEQLEIHYTPKHRSWLDIAEMELSALSRQCIANSKIPDLLTLKALPVP